MGVPWGTLPPRFPHELVPDGAALGPHHAYIGLSLAALSLWVVGDNLRRDEPVVSAVSVVVLGFGFAATWKYHHVTGALLSLAGALSLVVTPLWPSASSVGKAWSLAGRVTDRLAGARTVAVARSATVADVWPSGEWSPYPLRWRAVCVVGGLVALDDVVEHALGWVTPLDSAWVNYIYPALP